MTYTAKMKYLSATHDIQFYLEFWSDGPVDATSSKRIGVNLVRPTATSAWTESTVSHTAPSG
ncbi:MAG: hypothetical protein IJZ20_02295, partial [Clostridia bacterium]|nr:hypothetical protein [Clostridia bacterium]